MKKLLCILMTLLMINCLATGVYAAETSYSFMPQINGTDKSLIHNDYYKLYYNDIFEAEYANLKTYSLEGMTAHTLSELNDENYIYATVILSDISTTDYTEYNKSILTSVIAGEDILYKGATTPFTVIKLTKAKADILKDVEHVLGIFPAFFPARALMTNIVGEEYMGNVTGIDNVTSADARFLLRFSAGLETVSKSEAKQFYLCGDMNFDGRITSADARLVLRIAANLEEKSKIIFPSTDCWNDFM